METEAESWRRMCFWLVSVQCVNPSQFCCGAQRDKCLLWTAVPLPKDKPEALSFLLQKLGQQNQQMSCNSHSCSQARTSDGIATSVPTWENCSFSQCTQQLFHCFTAQVSLTLFYRLFRGWVCALLDRKFCLELSDGRFYYLHYLIFSKGYFWQKC